MWSSDEGYTQMLHQVRHLKVVNDIAERGVKLATDCIAKLTKNEAQRQYLYQVVEKQRQELPVIDKKGLKLLTIK